MNFKNITFSSDRGEKAPSIIPFKFPKSWTLITIGVLLLVIASLWTVIS